ncbi:soluble lytic murein transglycosylase-like protein [Novosphingobium fluoreni]|uniref:Soluble lytic murein transglycosylase-like protein n=1 Tax=Novosphingobium fluoreni TaxID=1391222 RepID=A0A7W6C0L2_9SPHN|nr:lytic transglycosylase domain-containing protein [Novosphingobium fluoreni]MBB3941284.1 soluble lytic murein transglycosylase-like protein [Novosphingobium fluoreni]
MGALRIAVAATVVALAAPANAESVADWHPYVAEASARFGVPTAWIEHVMRAESNGQTTLNGRPIRSSAGAMGLMQLMPATWADMRSRLGLGFNPDDPRDNILAGTFYLRLMYDRFGYPGLFGAYNAGPGRYAEHLAGRRTLPGETVTYLAKVAPIAPSSVTIARTQAPPATLFVVRNDPVRTEAEAQGDSPASPLFVVLSQRN